jgi:DNA-binding beta-propeller fold protein YncE
MKVNDFMKVSLLVLLTVCMVGCAPKSEKIRYPFPPETARYEWIGTFKTVEDFKKGFAETVKTMANDDLTGFLGPMGVAAYIDGRILVNDLYSQRIKTLDLELGTITVFSDYPFHTNVGVATDREGQVYVADGGKRQVLVFSPSGEMLRSIGDKDVFVKPVWLALNDELGRLYVTDPVAHNIKVFSLAGELLFTIGERGDEPGQFNAPQGLALDSKGRLFVADKFNARVQVFSADGEHLWHFGERGMFPHQFEQPRDLAFDSEGHLYVTDSLRSNFRVFTPEGELLLVVGDEQSLHQLGFASPSGIDVDSSDRVIIADLIAGRVTVWQYLSPAYLEQEQSQ